MAVTKKSRTEQRKEARSDKKKKKFDTWIQKQQNHKQKKSKPHSNVKTSKESHNRLIPCSKDNKISGSEFVTENSPTLEPRETSNAGIKSDSSKSSALEVKGQGKGKKNSKNKFEEYLEMDMKEGETSREEDLELERKLAKKLKVKKGKLSGDNDINLLLEGTTSEMDINEVDPVSEDVQEKRSKGKLAKKLKVKKGKLSGDNDINLLLEGTTSEMDINEVDFVSEDVQEKRSKGNSSSKKRKRKLLSEKEAEINGTIESRRKTKFEKYLEMEMLDKVPSAEADLYMERKLAKKLKVKEGKLKHGDDGIDELVDGIPSVLDFYDNDEKLDDTSLVKSSENKSSKRKSKKVKISENGGEDEMASDIVLKVSKSVPIPETRHLEETKVEQSAKYVAPHLKSRARNESEECAQIRRRIRGLLNRMSESNVESITNEVSTIFRSVARSTSSQIIIEEVLGSCSGGPRGNEQYAAVFAAFVAGMSGSVGMDFGAKLLESLAKCFQEEALKEDNLSLRNLTLLLSYLYIFGVCSSDLIYDFMAMLSKRLLESDVSTILAVLQCCGMKLRSDDPLAMKNFVLSVQNRANELKGSSETGQPNKNSKRMEFMLETISEIKNNKKRVKEDTPQHTRIKKWLQKLKAEDILVRGLKWSKLLEPDKKGQWWLSGELASSSSHIEEVANRIDMESLEAQKLLQLASAQRMNTDLRRAIFCIIMSGEDYVDTFEKLLRLDLQGKQDREIMRVLLSCCLQEKVFNKYYSVLATKLCKHDNNYVTTLKYCLWDQFKELDSMELIRSRNLSKFVVEMIASFTLSLSGLKTIDFGDTKQMTGKVIMHFRMVFETLFERPDSVIWNVFTRIAAELDLESLRNGIEFFIKSYVVGNDDSFAKKFKIAKKALANVEGILM